MRSLSWRLVCLHKKRYHTLTPVEYTAHRIRVRIPHCKQSQFNLSKITYSFTEEDGKSIPTPLSSPQHRQPAAPPEKPGHPQDVPKSHEPDGSQRSYISFLAMQLRHDPTTSVSEASVGTSALCVVDTCSRIVYARSWYKESTWNKSHRWIYSLLPAIPLCRQVLLFHRVCLNPDLD